MTPILMAQLDPATREFLTYMIESGLATVLGISVFFLSVAALLQGFVTFRNAHNAGRLIEKLSVNTDVLKEQARNAELRTQQQGELVKTLIVQTELAKAAAENAKGARDDVDALAKKHDSGVTDLKKLVEQESANTVEQVKAELTEMKTLLSGAIETIDKRDDKLVERLTEPYVKLLERVVNVQRLLEHVLPPEVRASIPVTITGDLTLTEAAALPPEPVTVTAEKPIEDKPDGDE